MATGFSYFNQSVHFHHFFQKTTANPTLGHGMIQLPKPLHFTRITRIGVRALQGSQLDGDYYRLSNRQKQHPDEEQLLKLLKDPLSSSVSNTAADLSVILEHIRSEDRLRRVYEKKILKPKHVETMWEIAGADNNSERADPIILPRDPLSPEKWIGMSWEIETGMSWEIETIKQSIIPRIPLLRGNRRFRLKGYLEMLICRGNLGIPGVIFLENSGLLSVERNPNDHPSREGCDLAFKSGDGKELLRHFPLDLIQPGSSDREKMNTEWNNALKVISAEKPWPLRDQFVVYLRCIGSNVLVGQAWKADGNPKISCRKLLFVKHPPQK